jgi:hypothetical protein
MPANDKLPVGTKKSKIYFRTSGYCGSLHRLQYSALNSTNPLHNID